jgi:acetolactate synthase-1/2/3 large subunit
VPGGGNMYLINSVKKSNKMKYTSFFHEQSAAIASEAYSRIKEDIGVCCVTSGPGSTNAITGVVGSWIESIPLIIISGQVKTENLTHIKDKVRQTGPQEVDIVSMVKKITKYSKTIKKKEQIPAELNKAYEIATTGRKGPVWLDIPLDIQSSYITKPSTLIKKKKGLEPFYCNYLPVFVVLPLYRVKNSINMHEVTSSTTGIKIKIIIIIIIVIIITSFIIIIIYNHHV